jgi:3-dehydroquinate synthase
MALSRVEVSAAAGAYPVVIGDGALAALPALLAELAPAHERIVVSSPTVWRHQGRRIAHALGRMRTTPVLVPDGERSKTVRTVQRVYDALLAAKADRGAVLVACGGGVIGDLAGFAAATYMRGIRLVHVPTTVLAQVDSAIGGKVGVNHPLGKNLIGAFHPPRLVVADPSVLRTLGARECRAGLYEVVKYGAIASPALFATLASSIPQLLDRDVQALEAVIAESCRIKAWVVSADERESGPRRILNFGHTVGHALEAVTCYGRFRHGEAVAHGMLAAMRIGVAKGLTTARAARAVDELIMAMGTLPTISDLSAKAVVTAMGRDKKIVDGTLHFVVVTDIGTTAIVTDVREADVKIALRALGCRA